MKISIWWGEVCSGSMISLYVAVRKTKCKGEGPWRGLTELYCQSNGHLIWSLDNWNVSTTLYWPPIICHKNKKSKLLKSILPSRLIFNNFINSIYFWKKMSKQPLKYDDSWSESSNNMERFRCRDEALDRFVRGLWMFFWHGEFQLLHQANEDDEKLSLGQSLTKTNPFAWKMKNRAEIHQDLLLL